ncbi:unnamed protein product [Sphagnum troendelagicum]|uniref:UBC core domain-containing protein n=1 Tax=Sphagnum troendelagicum TaxID=128251 RepID=A0ABP0UQD9_9BRYO
MIRKSIGFPCGEYEVENRHVESWVFLRFQKVTTFLHGLDKWSSAYDVWTILLSIQSLLGEPNNDSPLNSYAAALWSDEEGTLKVLL